MLIWIRNIDLHEKLKINHNFPTYYCKLTMQLLAPLGSQINISGGFGISIPPL